MPVTNNTVTVEVNGVDRTNKLLKDSVYGTLSVRNKSDSASLSFKNFEPNDRSEVLIKVNGTVIFGGYIVQKEAEVLGTGNNKVVFWHVECKDWSSILDQVIVSQTYTDTNDADILDDLFSTYTSLGIDTSTHVDILDPSFDVEFTELSLRTILDRLAERVGADWYISPDKKLYWFAPTSPPNAAFNIDTVSPNNTTTFNIRHNSLKYAINSESIINRVNVIGGVKTTTTKQTDTFTGDNSAKWFGELSQLVDSVLYVTFTDSSNNNYTIWGSFIGYGPDDQLISEGGTYQVVVNTQRKSIKLEGTAGQAPKAATTITVVYYYKEIIEFTLDDEVSQSIYGVFPVSIQDQKFSSEVEAEAIAQSILDVNAYGKATVFFDITKHGLIPGTLIQVNIPEIQVGSSSVIKLRLENDDFFLLENDDNILLESSGEIKSFLVQKVTFSTVTTNTDEFMLVASVTAGQYVPTIIDSLAKVSELQTANGYDRLKPSTARLSNFSSNLGEVVVGRAVFTDGGTAKFEWGTPNGATGAIIGLEDKDGNAYGAVYIYNGGTIKAKLGRLTGLPNVGTVSPSGWGLYTDNGYFSGIIAASTIIGGTISGQFISGGTVTGSQISGGTITGSLISGNTIIGGTIATSTPPINSSNPGVLMDSTGLYGYGSAGLTFRLSSDPAIKPYFSSGTITEVVYEVSTNAVIRTGTTNPRVQIDNSGIFAYNSSGVAKFTVDVATGKMTAVDGEFSGTVQSSAINSGTINGATITGNTISGNTISGNNISGGTITGVVVTANNISGGTISAARFTGGTVTSASLTSNNISGGTITGVLISGNTVSGGTITGTYITGGTINSGRFTGTAVFDYVSSPTGNITAINSSTANINNSVVVAAPNGVIYVNKISGPTPVQPMSSQGTLTLHDRWYINNSGWLWPSGSVAVGNRVIGLSTAGIDGIWFRDITNGSAYQVRVDSGVLSLFGPI